MSDHSKLKQLAEECIRQCDDGGKFADALKLMQRYAGPVEVLALIAENEALRKERDQLAEDNQGLLEDFEGCL